MIFDCFLYLQAARTCEGSSIGKIVATRMQNDNGRENTQQKSAVMNNYHVHYIWKKRKENNNNEEKKRLPRPKKEPKNKFCFRSKINSK